jgi:hypothetical protein
MELRPPTGYSFQSARWHRIQQVPSVPYTSFCFFTTAALESPLGEDGEGLHGVDSLFFSLPPCL